MTRVGQHRVSLAAERIDFVPDTAVTLNGIGQGYITDRVVALPHMSSATIEGRVDMGEKVIINIKAFLDGHAPPDRVHPAMF